MREKMAQILHLLSAPHRIERTLSLAEMQLNHVLFKHETPRLDVMTFDQFLAQLHRNAPMLCDLLTSGGEAAEAVQWIRAKFQSLIKESMNLPLPIFYNPDTSFALLSYALTRYLRPKLVLETGVGYGITSALTLAALMRNNIGRLVSIDFPPLADPYGSCIGIAVPEHLRKNRWLLHHGSSRRSLPIILSNVERIDLFISDSDNIYTLQQHEFKLVYPKLSVGGAVIFNNICSKFQMFLQSINNIQFHSIVQIEKSPCVTGLILKKK